MASVDDDEYSSSAEAQELRLHHPSTHSRFANKDGYSSSNSQKRRRMYSGENQLYSMRKCDLSDLLDKKLSLYIDPLQQQMEEMQKSLAFKNTVQMESRIKSLELENKHLREQINGMDTYSRRNNLRFYDLTEDIHEDCEQKLLSKLQSLIPDFNDRTFERVHRLGPKGKGKTRPIIAKFAHFKDKLCVLKKRNEFLQMKIQMSDDFCKEVESNRRDLIPILKEGRKLGMPSKLIGDKLIVSGGVYTKSDIHKLPNELKPETISTRTKNNITAFYTKESPLSNFFPCEFQVGNDKFNCGEQYLTVAKAKLFHDSDTVSKLFQENNPVNQKRIGKEVKNYVHKEWLTSSEELVYKGILAKFNQSDYLKNFLLATKDSLIVEASRDTVWGVGLTMSDDNIWVMDKHRGENKLGKILMRVRCDIKAKK